MTHLTTYADALRGAGLPTRLRVTQLAQYVVVALALWFLVTLAQALLVMPMLERAADVTDARLGTLALRWDDLCRWLVPRGPGVPIPAVALAAILFIGWAATWHWTRSYRRRLALHQLPRPAEFVVFWLLVGCIAAIGIAAALPIGLSVSLVIHTADTGTPGNGLALGPRRNNLDSFILWDEACSSSHRGMNAVSGTVQIAPRC